MALTQVSSEGIKDAQVKTADILDANITTAKVADNAITGAKIADNLDIPDNNQIRFGTGNDLQIYHNGSHSWIKNNTGYLHINASTVELKNAADNETTLKAIQDGAVELYHDNVKTFETMSHGAYLYGPEGGTCNLYMSADENDDAPDKWRLRVLDSSSQWSLENYNNGSAWEANIKAVGDGAVELYHNNIKTFETMSHGAYLYGPEGGTANLYIYADEGDDNADKWRLRNDAAAAFTIQNYASGSWETSIECNGDGNVELYYDNAKKLETTSAGVEVTGTLVFDSSVSGGTIKLQDDQKLFLGGGDDLKIYHDGTQNLIEGTAPLYIKGSPVVLYKGGSTEKYFEGVADGEVKLYHNGIKKLETTSVGAHVWGNLDFMDNARVRLGTNTDLQIFHDGSNSWLQNGTNTLILASNLLELKNNAGDETYLKGTANGAVELYYDNEQVFQTLPEGIKVTGGAENEEAVVSVAYSTVPTQLSSSYDGTWGESFFSINKWRNSDGSASWSASNNTSYASAAIGLNAGTSNSNIQMYTAASPNTNPTSKFEVWSTGDVNIVDGNLRVANGHGIDFSATADNGVSTPNELLSDYEEGTWTPTIISGGYGIGTIYKASYRRIGTAVLVQMYIVLNGSASSNTFQMGGLPFTNAANGYTTGIVDFGKGGKKGAYVRVTTSGTTLTFYYSSENTSTNRVQMVGDHIGSGYIIFNLHYFLT